MDETMFNPFLGYSNKTLWWSIRGGVSNLSSRLGFQLFSSLKNIPQKQVEGIHQGLHFLHHVSQFSAPNSSCNGFCWKMTSKFPSSVSQSDVFAKLMWR